MNTDLKIAIVLGFIFFAYICLKAYRYFFVPVRRRIIKRTHKDGSIDYSVQINTGAIPFLWWKTDSFNCWYGPGICIVYCRGMSLKSAEDYIQEKDEEARKRDGEKIIKREAI